MHGTPSFHADTDPDARSGTLVNLRLATLADGGWGLVEDAALAWNDGRITYAGPRSGFDAATASAPPRDAGGLLATPGLVDCHTHLVFAGERAGEFEQRLEGASYEDIARAGGGIASTVRATRAAGFDALLAASLPRARALLRDGVTTVEIKSGYGLETATELRMLDVARAIGEQLGIGVRTSFLGAHALPPEYAGRADDYVEHLCGAMLPEVAASGLADAVDAYCEGIGFSPAQVSRVFSVARELGLPVKLHADQLSDLGGARLAAADFAAMSADHIEYTGEDGVRAMAAAGTVAVLLPGAFYALREERLPPIAALRAHGVPMAVATDLNPGTSPLLSLRLAANMACTLFRLTPLEAIQGITVHAAAALGLGDRGRLEPGLRADIALWDVASPAELAYWIGGLPAAGVVAGGRRLA